MAQPTIPGQLHSGERVRAVRADIHLHFARIQIILHHCDAVTAICRCVCQDHGMTCVIETCATLHARAIPARQRYTSLLKMIADDSQKNFNTVTLKIDEELRIDVANDKQACVKLLSGTAEIFGTELAPQKTYTLTATSVGVFTWSG
jgi:hypothetical protein